MMNNLKSAKKDYGEGCQVYRTSVSSLSIKFESGKFNNENK